MLNHSYLSPSGRVSKRSRKAMLKRVYRELFGDGLSGPIVKQEPEKERLLRRAAELRHLAAGGMKPRAYLKEALRLEALATDKTSN